MNLKLPYDVCRCTNENCPQREGCARYTNFREGNMRPHYGSPVSKFGIWVHDEFICGDMIPDEKA